MTNQKGVAEKLLQTGAVQLRPGQPYIWASGWKSPIYCDNRVILSQPYIRDYIKSEMCNVVFEQFADASLVAGVATAGIPWGVLVADQLKLPFIYVRPKPKEHGMGNQIEGHFKKGQKAIIIEDLVSTGKSSLQVVDILRKAGLEAEGMVSIFNYQFELASRAFQQQAIRLQSLTNYASLLTVARQKGIIGTEEMDILLKWRQEPENWTGL